MLELTRAGTVLIIFAQVVIYAVTTIWKIYLGAIIIKREFSTGFNMVKLRAEKEISRLMKKILAFNGSPRKTGNTSTMLKQFIEGANHHKAHTEIVDVGDIHLEYCRGCLRCNVLGHCAINGDEWEKISHKIEEADVLIFASPVYFHHVTAPMKKLIDRFRSFIHVQVTQTGLIHTPRKIWTKDFVLLLSMGSSDTIDAQPIIDLFRFMINILGSGNKLHVISATRLAVVHQLLKSKEELSQLYEKMNIPVHLAAADYDTNQETLALCYTLGKKLT
jgi:putative NADPH-quinone reductase